MSVDDIGRRPRNRNEPTDLKLQSGTGSHSGCSPTFLKTIYLDWALLLPQLAQRSEPLAHHAQEWLAWALRLTTRLCLNGPKCGTSCAWTRLKVRALVRQWTRMTARKLRRAWRCLIVQRLQGTLYSSPPWNKALTRLG